MPLGDYIAIACALISIGCVARAIVVSRAQRERRKARQGWRL